MWSNNSQQHNHLLLGLARQQHLVSSYLQRRRRRRQQATMERTTRLLSLVQGKMAQAMIKPLIDTKIQPEHKIAIYDVSTSILNHVVEEFPTIQVAQSIAVRVVFCSRKMYYAWTIDWSKVLFVCTGFEEVGVGTSIRRLSTILPFLCHCRKH